MDNLYEYMDDLANINDYVEHSITAIKNQRNFMSYYESELKSNDDFALESLKNQGALYNLILNVYAIYEDTVKTTLLLVLEILEKHQYKLRDLKKSLRILYFVKEIDNIRFIFGNSKKNNDKDSNFYFVNNINNFYDYVNEDKIFEANDNMIDTKSYLNYDVLIKLLDYFGIETSIYNKYKIWIKTLVHYRNNIAHGNYRDLNTIPNHIRELDENDYDLLCNEIISFIELFHSELNKYIIDKIYLDIN